THTPFQELDPNEMEIFPHPGSADERYLNSARYLDHCIQDFVGKLPEGTTLVMYGDHTTSMHTPIFNSDENGQTEFIGCLIYQKGKNLAKQQKTRHQLTTNDGTYNLLDVMNYLRSSIISGEKSAPLSKTNLNFTGVSH